MSILLASGSPQRSAILTQIDIPFRVLVPEVDEQEMGVPRELAEHNARLKASASAAHAVGDELILTCDTVVDVDGIPFGKPENAEDAFTMLALLRGRVHNVIGGLVVHQPSTGTWVTRVVSTMVRFRDFPDEILNRYLEGEEWRGRAGGYAIQGTGAGMVQGIGGCYQNVVGLPVAALLGILEETEGWNTLARLPLPLPLPLR